MIVSRARCNDMDKSFFVVMNCINIADNLQAFAEHKRKIGKYQRKQGVMQRFHDGYLGNPEKIKFI